MCLFHHELWCVVVIGFALESCCHISSWGMFCRLPSHSCRSGAGGVILERSAVVFQKWICQHCCVIETIHCCHPWEQRSPCFETVPFDSVFVRFSSSSSYPRCVYETSYPFNQLLQDLQWLCTHFKNTSRHVYTRELPWAVRDLYMFSYIHIPLIKCYIKKTQAFFTCPVCENRRCWV